MREEGGGRGDEKKAQKYRGACGVALRWGQGGQAVGWRITAFGALSPKRGDVLQASLSSKVWGLKAVGEKMEE
jgi:hypothetical protein